MRNELRDIGEGTIRRINWQDLTPVVFLAKIPGAAIGFRTLYLSAIGLLLTIVAGYGLNIAFPGFEGRGANDPKHASNQQVIESKFRDPVDISPLFTTSRLSPSKGLEKNIESLFWQGINAPWILFHYAAAKVWNFGYEGHVSWVALGWFAFLLLLWGYMGTAVCRVAALHLTVREKISFGSLNTFLRRYGVSAHFAVLLAMFFIFCCFGVLWVFGLMLKCWGLSFIAAIFFPLALAAGLLLTILNILLFFGWPLLIAAVAVEGSDAFDAFSRISSYICRRPLHYAFYLACSTLLGMLCFFLFTLVFDSTGHLVAAYCPPKPAGAALSGTMTFFIQPDFFRDVSPAYWLVAVWMGLFHLVKVAFLFAYFWCSAVAIYLLLRKSVDGTPLDDIFRPSGESQPLPFPALKPDEKGAPVLQQ